MKHFSRLCYKIEQNIYYELNTTHLLQLMCHVSIIEENSDMLYGFAFFLYNVSYFYNLCLAIMCLLIRHLPLPTARMLSFHFAIYCGPRI